MELKRFCWKAAASLRHRGWRVFVWNALWYSSLVIGSLSAAAAAAGKIDAKSLPIWAQAAQPGLLSFQSSIWWLTPSLIGLLGIIAFIKRQIGEPWVWRVVGELINDHRSAFFLNVDNDMSHEHRVTLFKRYSRFHPYCWFLRPWEPHLVGVARSGHLTQQMSSVFVVQDNGRLDGIAGQAYGARRTIGPVKLIKITCTTNPENLKKYADKSCCSLEYVKEHVKNEGRQMPRALLAFPINVRGRPWGVVVLDSIDADSLDSVPSASYDVMAKTLGKLLERV